MGTVITTIDFLTKKIQLSIEELGQETNELKRYELLDYQDRLMDSLFEESEKISKKNDLEAMEHLLAQLRFIIERAEPN